MASRKGGNHKAGGAQATNISLEGFQNYEDYLDSMVTRKDIDYLGSDDVARMVAEMGYRCSGDILTREQYLAVRYEEQLQFKKLRDALKLTSHNVNITDNFLLALAERERANRNGIISTIIHLRALTRHGVEVSGYIDYKQRLMTDQFREYFTGEEILMPTPNDLSFFNWRTEHCTWNSSPNYTPVCTESGLKFRHRFDRQVINVDPKASSPGENTYRKELTNEKYTQIIFFDHIPRKKC